MQVQRCTWNYKHFFFSLIIICKENLIYFWKELNACILKGQCEMKCYNCHYQVDYKVCWYVFPKYQRYQKGRHFNKHFDET